MLESIVLYQVVAEKKTSKPLEFKIKIHSLYITFFWRKQHNGWYLLAVKPRVDGLWRCIMMTTPRYFPGRETLSYSLQNLYHKSMSLHMFHISKDKSIRIYFYTSYISIWRVKNDNSFNLEVLSVLLRSVTPINVFILLLIT